MKIITSLHKRLNNRVFKLEDDKIVESKEYETICLINLHEKINKVYRFSTLLETTKWKKLSHCLCEKCTIYSVQRGNTVYIEVKV